MNFICLSYIAICISGYYFFILIINISVRIITFDVSFTVKNISISIITYDFSFCHNVAIMVCGHLRYSTRCV